MSDIFLLMHTLLEGPKIPRPINYRSCNVIAHCHNMPNNSAELPLF